MQDDAGSGSARLGDYFAEEVRHIAKFHACFDVRATLDERIEDTKLFSGDVDYLIQPDGIFDRVRLAGEHLEGRHGAERAVDQEREVVGFDRAGVAGFDDDGRFTANRSGVVEIASGGRVGRTFAPDDNVIKTEGQHHFLGDSVLGVAAGG